MKISETSAHEITQRMLQTPETLREFGLLLLRCSVYDESAFRIISSCVNYDAITCSYDRNDFIDPVQALVFSGLQEFQKTWIEGNPWPRSVIDWAQALAPHYDLFFRKNPEFPDLYKSAAIELLIELAPPRPGEYDRVSDGLADYVLALRYHQAESTMGRLPPAAKRELLEKIPLSIRIPGGEVESLSNEQMLDSIFASTAATKPFFTGVTSFDYHYGRKAVGGDAWLFFGHPGGGKTNLACQTAGFTAHNGKHVLYLTTEVKAPVILMRACSAVTSISYSVLRGLAGSNGQHPQADEFRKWVTHGPGKNIQIFDYRDIPGKDYKEKIARMLDGFERKAKKLPDLIIWDWIGKALDSGFETPWQKREAYNGVADKMSSLADELDIQTLTLAQASKETKNKVNLHESNTQDSKSLADPMEGVCGITSLIDTSEGTAGDREVHKENQYFVVCKCREEEALRLGVVRNFAYARFDALR